MRIPFFVAVLGLLAACSASLGPDRAEIESKLSFNLAPNWTLSDFQITAEEDAGTPTQPDVRSRFVAKVVLARDLYKSEERLLGREVLSKVRSSGDMEIELYGIARSKQSAGRWDISFDLDNGSGIEMPGKPLSEFGDYVVVGTAEEASLREEAAKRAETERLAQEEAERARLEAEKLAQEEAKALTEATGAIFKPGTRLPFRYTNARTQRTGTRTFVIVEHEPVTRTFSGTYGDDGKTIPISGSYDRQAVTIVQNDGKCRFELVVSGPTLMGEYAGPPLGGCGRGTVEVGLQ